MEYPNLLFYHSKLFIQNYVQNHINNYLFSYNHRKGSKSIDIHKYLFMYTCKNETDSVAFQKIKFAELIRSQGVCFLRPSQCKLKQQ